MVIDLRKRREPPPESAVDLLLECHERIRRFTRLARELARAEAPEAHIADAARSLCAYFGRAFLLHAEDEDRSIRPRLEAAGRLAEELEDVAGQHDEMHRALEGLLESWRAIADAPAERDARREGLARDTDALADRIERHLALEEERVFPVLREVLTPEQDREIVREMRARRA